MSDINENPFEELIKRLPEEINACYTFLEDKVSKINTFDLLSNISYYNHLQDITKYSDYRGDKGFHIAEIIALLCLKNNYVETTQISLEEFPNIITTIQEKANDYCMKKIFLNTTNRNIDENPMKKITHALEFEAKQIRNPVCPEHHYLFSEKMYQPIEDEIKKRFGFTIKESIIMRNSMIDLINKKAEECHNETLKTAEVQYKKLIQYKKGLHSVNETIFSKDVLEELTKCSDIEIKTFVENYYIRLPLFTFSEVYCFTVEEIAQFSNISNEAVKSFLELMSCSFPSVEKEVEILAPYSILKTKPILQHKNKYLVPSFPVLTFSVEEVIEKVLKNSNLKKRCDDAREDFLLKQGLECFARILPKAVIYPPNLSYDYDGKRCETDAIVAYDTVLFIIEAKGHTISPRARNGYIDRTERDLKDIVKESYTQGIRTLDYINSCNSAEFKTKDRKHIEISKKDFDEVIIVSLAMEPIGNLAMLMKATNEIGYFKDGHFPWIISIYDLFIMADLFENPFMLIHYIKQRKKFLEYHNVSIHEELDLMMYYLYNGLHIESYLEDEDGKPYSELILETNTDKINDYYMQLYNGREKHAKKPTWKIPYDLNNLLLQLDKSELRNRVNIALIFLSINNKSIRKIFESIEKIRKGYSRDKNIHDFSLYFEAENGFGITFMIGENLEELTQKMYFHCDYKKREQKANAWIGLGTTSLKYPINFEVSYYKKR
jgi:hypothetical protein